MHAQALLSLAIMALTSMAVADETATILFTEMDHDLVGKVIGTVHETSRILHATRKSLN